LIKYYNSRNKNKIIKFTDKSFRINTEIFNKKNKNCQFHGDFKEDRNQYTDQKKVQCNF